MKEKENNPKPTYREILLTILNIENKEVAEIVRVGKDHISTWKKLGKIPAKYEDAIGEFLKEKGILPKDKE